MDSRPGEGAPGAAGGLAPGEDGTIVGRPKTPEQMATDKRIQQTQAQVDQVVDIIKTNVVKILDRDMKLGELGEKAEALKQEAEQFEQQAGKLKRKFWFQNIKMLIIMGVIGLVILAIIIVKFMPDNTAQPIEIARQPIEIAPQTAVPAQPESDK